MTNQKQFGVWIDIQTATIKGKEPGEKGEVLIMGSVKGAKASTNPSEKTALNQQRSIQRKFFKEIPIYLQNATYIDVPGTRPAQEQHMHHRARSKNTKADGSVSNKMRDEKLGEFMTARLN